MSTRLQVVLDEAELREIRKAARRQRMTVSEWVRGAIRAARRAEPRPDPGRRLAAIRSASRHAFPTAGIDQMLGDIDRGRRDESQ